MVLLAIFTSVSATQPPDTDPITDEYKAAVLAGLMEADIASMSRAIDLGLLSCEELTAYYLERIEAYNDTYNCFITICDDALEIARQRDVQLAAGEAKGSLFGIPMVIKDNMDYAGYHTTSGHKKSNSPVASTNADVVQYLIDEGAVIIGKTNMSTDAQDARASISAAVGQTYNAYGTHLSSGGSSGGSASAVSLNFAAAGLGTDTNSSLRYPAALNGCVSLRPTWDSLSTKGIDSLNRTRDVPGAITRTVYDQALVLDAISGGQTSYADNLDPKALQGMRIGVLDQTFCTNSFRSEADLDAEVIAAFNQAVADLESCGAEIVHMRISGLFTMSNETLNSNSSSLKNRLYEAFREALAANNVSAVVFPTYVSAPLKTGTDANGVYWDIYSQRYETNCKVLGPSCSVPEISVPIGIHSTGAGIGMEICALKNQEQLLLNIAYAYTLSYDHRAVPAGAANLYSDTYQGTLAQVLNEYEAALETIQATEPPTAAPTEAPTESPTEAPAETATAPTEQTTPATEPVPAEPEPASGSTVDYWILGVSYSLVGIFLIDQVRQFFLRRKRRKTRKQPRFVHYK